MDWRSIIQHAIVFVAVVAVRNPSARADPQRFEGHQLVAITIRSQADLRTLRSLEAASADFDVWSHRMTVGVVDVRVSPRQKLALDASRLPYVVRRAINPDPLATVHAERAAAADGGFFDAFRTFDEYVAFLDELADAHPTLAEVISLGSSVEDRDLWAIRITGPGANKRGVFYHAGQHAREWLGPPVVAFTAQHLLTNYGLDDTVTTLVDNVEWFLMPVVNPDGYVYAWTTYRFWRKNRRDNNDGTYGVDLNRNWAIGWGGAGSSGVTDSNTYRGPFAFSEPETQALRDFFFAHPKLRAHLDIHTYGNYLMWPWGYTSDLPLDHTTFQDLGTTMAQHVFDVHGTTYTTGSLATTLYFASGASIDWVYGNRGAKSFLIELRGQDFDVPASEIIPACEENLPAMLYLASWTPDCNENGVSDWCDTDCDEAGCGAPCGQSLDCNTNGTPDECEPDCDGNGIPDDCVPPADEDQDGVNDCLDLCPQTTPPDSCHPCPPLGDCCWLDGAYCLPDYTPQDCLDEAGVPECLPPPCRHGCLLGDFDGDGDLDLADTRCLWNCFSGPPAAHHFPPPSAECKATFDFDGNGGIDLSDYARFQALDMGP